MEEPFKFLSFRGAGVYRLGSPPSGTGEFSEETLRSRAEICPARIGGQAEDSEEFQFKAEDHFRISPGKRQRLQESAHKMVDFPQGCLRLRCLFNQQRGIGSLPEKSDVLPQNRIGVHQDRFAQGVQFRAAAPEETELRFVEEVQFAAKG